MCVALGARFCAIREPQLRPTPHQAAPDHQQQTTKTVVNGFSRPRGRSRQLQVLFGNTKSLESAETRGRSPKCPKRIPQVAGCISGRLFGALRRLP
eukprot:10002431-Alexandrium_andersonii.AAC.1